MISAKYIIEKKNFPLLKKKSLNVFIDSIVPQKVKNEQTHIYIYLNFSYMMPLLH